MSVGFAELVETTYIGRIVHALATRRAMEMGLWRLKWCLGALRDAPVLECTADCADRELRSTVKIRVMVDQSGGAITRARPLKYLMCGSDWTSRPSPFIREAVQYELPSIYKMMHTIN